MPYGVSNSFRRGMMRTYSRSGKRVVTDWDLEDGDGHEIPRKRIRMDKQGMVVVEEEVGRCGGGAEEEEELGGKSCGEGGGDEGRVAEQRSSSTASSSPPPVDSELFSDSRAEGTSPPSSPPPPVALLPSPPPPTRKPTFSFLKRKRSSRDDDQAISEAQPLADITHNVVRRAQPTTAKKTTRLMQMQIDLGGEVRRTCEGCDMEYVPCNKADKAVHEAFHDLHLHGVDLGKAFVKDGSLKRLQSTRKVLGVHEDIVVVDRRSSDKVKKKARRVLEVVNADLSAPVIEDEQLWGALEPGSTVPKRRTSKKRKAKNEAPDSKGDRFKIFLYFVNGRCVGFCLAEKINSAFRVVDPNAPSISTSSSISVSSQTDVALLGISRIWTSKSFRLQNIAADLLDCARSNFFYGMELTKDLVAFSQPTESGGRLAERWFEAKTGWHVYTEEQ